jgi:hypothetical protein
MANPTDGTRMVAALASRELGRPVNRKRVQRVMRSHQLLQPTRSSDRRRRPGFFRVTRPDALWHMDMTKVWTAQHGWVYLHAIIDCCTREITGWSLELRCHRRRGDRLCRGGSLGARHPAWTAHPRHRQWQPVHRPRLPKAPIGTYRPAGSPTAVAATGIPSRRRSSSPGSGSSRSAWHGDQSGSRSTRRERRSPPTSMATIAGRTLGWPTAPQPRSPPPGGQTPTSYKPQRPEPSTPTGSTSIGWSAMRAWRCWWSWLTDSG